MSFCMFAACKNVSEFDLATFFFPPRWLRGKQLDIKLIHFRAYFKRQRKIFQNLSPGLTGLFSLVYVYIAVKTLCSNPSSATKALYAGCINDHFFPQTSICYCANENVPSCH